MKDTRQIEAAELFVQKVSAVILPVIKEMEDRMDGIQAEIKELKSVSSEVSQQQAEQKHLLENLQLTIPPADTRTFELLAEASYQRLLKIVAALPRKHHFSIELYPSFPQQGFFKKLWMYRFLSIVLIVTVLGFYSLSKEWINRHYDESSYKKAWDYIYDHADKATKKKLSRMYREANGPDHKQ